MAKLKSCGFLIYRDLPSSMNGSANPQAVNELQIRQLESLQRDGPRAEAMADPGLRTILLLKHRNRWDLPKGHVDPGETNLECALRELEEETGITKGDIEIDPDFRFKAKYKVNYKKLSDRPVKKKLIIYLARLTRTVEINPTEHIGFEWVTWSPPHSIQQKTIDPLLAEVAEHWETG
ncbi:MAG: NUDIX domain-containing protein [Planctomycetota bacterium]